MGPAPVFISFSFYFYFSAANPSRCFSLCLFTSFLYLVLLLSPFPSSFIFISLCGALVVLVLVFLSGLSYTAYMVAFLAVRVLYVMWLSFVYFALVCLLFLGLNRFLARMSFAGYFHARILMSAFFLFVCFVLFFSETVFVLGLFWCNFLYHVTTAGFVADQLIM